jgi:hypothetical protein
MREKRNSVTKSPKIRPVRKDRTRTQDGKEPQKKKTTQTRLHEYNHIHNPDKHFPKSLTYTFF